jgi:hypothetical protein
VHLLIDTDRTTYHLGDSIRVRIALKKVSSTPIGWSPGHHEEGVKLIVTTTDGQVVTPTFYFGRGAAGAADT